jgi:hypothetical protein
VLDEIAHVDFAGSTWKRDLIIAKPPMNTAEGRILPVLANAIAAFRHAPEWGGVLGFNEFGFGTVALKPAPWGIVPKGEWTDHEDRLAAEWLQKQGILVSVEIAGQAVQTAAQDHLFHPVKAYLQGLQWDGVERLDSWLSAYLGAADTEYSRAVGSRWLISAVARIFRPGAKADCCLILEGPQGIRKSTALRTLAGDYFTDELADLGSKDAAMQTRGVWIIELSELDSLSNSDVARIKAFMSERQTDFGHPTVCDWWNRRCNVSLPVRSITALICVTRLAAGVFGLSPVAGSRLTSWLAIGTSCGPRPRFGLILGRHGGWRLPS